MSEKGYHDIVKIMLSFYANFLVETQSYGSLLHIAYKNDDSEMIKLLVEYNLEKNDKDYQTALKVEEAINKEFYINCAENPYILLDKNCLVPIEMYNGVLYRMSSAFFLKK